MTFNCWQPFWTASYLNLGINSLLNKQVKRKNIKPESWWTGSKDQFVAFDFSLISDQSHIKEVLLLTHVLKRRVHVRCKVVPFQTIFVTLRHRSPHVNFTNFIFEQKKTKPGIKTRRSSQNPVVGITRPVALPVCADRQTSTADRAGREGTVSGQGRDLYLGKAGQFQGNAQTDVSSATGFFVFWPGFDSTCTPQLDAGAGLFGLVWRFVLRENDELLEGFWPFPLKKSQNAMIVRDSLNLSRIFQR